MKSITPRLNGLGFTKRKWGIFWKDLAPEILGFFAFGTNPDRKTGAIGFWPNVAVRFQTLSKLESDLLGTEFDKYGATPIARNIGYLMPENTFMEWYAQSPADADDVAAGMVAALEQYGLPFMERYKSLSEAISFMRPNNYGGNVYDSFTLILAYALLGERHKAYEVLNYWVKSVGEDKPHEFRALRQFAQNFNARIASIPASEA
jgi:hypothetical protein